MSPTVFDGIMAASSIDWNTFGVAEYNDLVQRRLSDPSDAVPNWNDIVGQLRLEADALQGHHDGQLLALRNRFTEILFDQVRAQELVDGLETIRRSKFMIREAMDANRDAYLQRLGEIERTVWSIAAYPIDKYSSLAEIGRLQVERNRSFAHEQGIGLSGWYVDSEVNLLGAEFAEGLAAMIHPESRGGPAGG